MHSRDVLDITPPVGPAFTLVETHLLAGIAHLTAGGSKRCRCRSRGSARGRRARPADLPVRDDRSRGAARRAPASRNGSRRPARRHRRPAARRTGAEHRSRAPIATGGAQPERAPRAAISADKSDAARDRAASSTSPSTRSTRTSATSTPSSVRAIALRPSGAHASCGSSRPGAPEHRRSSASAVARTITRFRRRRLTRSGCRMIAWPHRRACTRSG